MHLFLFLLFLQEWRSEEVGDGVVWKYRHRDKQSVSVLEVDLKKAKLRVVDATGKERTSALAGKTRAVAAVNGGYFNGKGDPVGLLKIDGKILGEPNERPAIGVDAKDRVLIRSSPGEWKDAVHAMGAGPMLVEEGKVKVGGGFGHEKSRHPRTAAGLTSKNLFILVAVDGRVPEALGMTCEELAKLMIDLGCATAINLDGGGSTTMWVRGDGVVNNPCDDKKFDPAGERAVANILVLLAKDVIVEKIEKKGTVEIQFDGTYDVTVKGRCRIGGKDFKGGKLELKAGPLEIEGDCEVRFVEQ